MTHSLNIFPGETHDGATTYALVGEYITTYQQIEDYLGFVFAASLDRNLMKCLAIFSVARGLEAKLDIITAALIGKDKNTIDNWSKIRKEILLAAKARNELAHARPVNFGDIKVEALSDGSAAVYQIKPEFQLRKSEKKAEIIWTKAAMEKQLLKGNNLFNNLYTFSSVLLEGKPFNQ